MLFLFTSFAGLVLPAGIERVLSASDAYGVLQIERGSSTRVKDIQHAHRSIALKVHPDHHCTTTGPVCDAAHRAMVRVSDARDELLHSVPVAPHSARPAANSEDHAHALLEAAGILAQLIFVAVAFHLIKLFDSATRFLKLCWRGRRLAARLSASRWRRWWSYLSSFVLAAYAPCAHLLVHVPRHETLLRWVWRRSGKGIIRTDLALNTRLAYTIYWAEPAWPGAHGGRTQTILTRPSTTTAATHARGTLLKRLVSCFMVFCSSFM